MFLSIKYLLRLITVLLGLSISFTSDAYPGMDTVRIPTKVYNATHQDPGQSKWEILVLVGVLGFIGLKNREPHESGL